MNRRIARFLEEHRPATPCLVFDLDTAEQKCREMAKAMPEARIYCAVKANPAAEILKRLARLGSAFDVASLAEVDLCLAAGVDPRDLSYGNTIKKERDIAAAFARGVTLFAFDSAEELEKIARAAPGARVFCRLLAGSEGAEWPLSRKFRCDYAMARALMLKAPALGLVPFGLSFHGGSQQCDPARWDEAVAESARLFRELEAEGIELGMLNLGGGLAETMDEMIQYPVGAPREGGPTGKVIVAGPSCDSVDVLYEKADYRLPLDLKAGDRLAFLSAGAYTTTYASIGFNGFPPLTEHYI